MEWQTERKQKANWAPIEEVDQNTSMSVRKHDTWNFIGSNIFGTMEINSTRRFLWVHSTYQYCIEDRKDIPKLSPFVSWPVAMIRLTHTDSNYPCLEQIVMVPKMFEILKFDSSVWRYPVILHVVKNLCFKIIVYLKYSYRLTGSILAYDGIQWYYM